MGADAATAWVGLGGLGASDGDSEAALGPFKFRPWARSGRGPGGPPPSQAASASEAARAWPGAAAAWGEPVEERQPQRFCSLSEASGASGGAFFSGAETRSCPPRGGEDFKLVGGCKLSEFVTVLGRARVPGSDPARLGQSHWGLVAGQLACSGQASKIFYIYKTI